MKNEANRTLEKIQNQKKQNKGNQISSTVKKKTADRTF